MKEEDSSRYYHDKWKSLMEKSAETKAGWQETEQIQGIEGRSGNKTVGLNEVIIICM